MSIEGTVTTNVAEDVIRTWLQRHKRGLLVRFKVGEEVEAFFKGYSGYSQSAREFGPAWLPIEEKGSVPKIWDFKAPSMSDGQYTLNNVGEALMLGGQPMRSPDGSGRNIINPRIPNISFLRMVGASAEGGAGFVLDTIISKTEMEELSNAITRACGVFYNDYIKQAQFDIRVSCVPTQVQIYPFPPPESAVPRENASF